MNRYTVKVVMENKETYIWKHMGGRDAKQATEKALFGVRLDGNQGEIAKIEVREEV